ncbi:sulfite exporter TauE/SafE family protein [Corticibacter populi]|uniref:Sulfite exporter TauE/SafE family protein n=1 Tax=Corticibacter populi TaxID=1550736 RepID=A0A3M6QXF9_9BURK|nr:sulfite exporter TauE/SafE family protein [Corticibacter populi]RMX07683.1 sulfite exporter TauE/SafE family protein [Corticibacter populi]RZS30191.1 hypothetical protein EV687_3688 [Corticibacter populi]
MSTALLATAFLMGLAGSPHCATMCGVACASLCRRPASGDSDTLATSAISTLPLLRLATTDSPGHPPAAAPAPAISALSWLLLGRMLGYAAAGAIAASLVGSLQWMAQHFSALKPAWTLFQVTVLAWGLVLLLFGRQPLWLDQQLARWGRQAGQFMRPVLRSHVGSLGVGLAWALLPCGLLYSALLLAGLANGPWQGAATMLAFALGSSVGLLAVPLAWRQWQKLREHHREAWINRLAGLALIGAAGWAMWMQWGHDFLVWCGLA